MSNETRINDGLAIAIIWDIADVYSLDSDLSEAQAKQVLQLMNSEHDASIGINWEVIEIWIDHVKRG